MMGSIHRLRHLQDQEHPIVKFSLSVIVEVILSIATKPPETGGILLGPIGSDDVTDFFFDHHANTTSATYSPDHIGLMEKMQKDWKPSGIDMKGFVHSHPGGYEQLSHGDLQYINRLLKKNPDMSMFIAPLVLPEARRMCPFVVLRDHPWEPREATIVLT